MNACRRIVFMCLAIAAWVIHQDHRYLRLLLVLAVAAVDVSAIVVPGRAAPTTYDINPALSSLKMTMYAGGPPSAGGTQISFPQTPGSDITHLFGTLDAVTDGTSYVSFPGGSTIQFANQPTNQLPDADGGDATGPDPDGTGGAEAQYGLIINIPGVATGFLSLSTLLAFYHDSMAGDTELAAGVFDARELIFGTSHSNAAYWLDATQSGGGIVTGRYDPNIPEIWDPGGNLPAGLELLGSVTTLGNVQTITTSIYSDLEGHLLGIPIEFVFTGTIVATTAIPEPGTMVVAGIGLVALVPMLRRPIRRLHAPMRT